MVGEIGAAPPHLAADEGIYITWELGDRPGALSSLVLPLVPLSTLSIFQPQTAEALHHSITLWRIISGTASQKGSRFRKAVFAPW